jgi:hypothetical protein
MTAANPTAAGASQPNPAAIQRFIAQYKASDPPEWLQELTRLVVERRQIERRILEICPSGEELLALIHAPRLARVTGERKGRFGAPAFSRLPKPYPAARNPRYNAPRAVTDLPDR